MTRFEKLAKSYAAMGLATLFHAVFATSLSVQSLVL